MMDALRSRGMLENSIVLFMSDNGAPTEGLLSNQGSNYPLRGVNSSCTLYSNYLFRSLTSSFDILTDEG